MRADREIANDAASEDGPIAFFDGESGVCTRSVQFLLERDRDARMRFAPLQGDTAVQMLPAENVRDLDTMAFHEEGVLYFRSTALLRAVAFGGGVHGACARDALWIPAPLRDLVYRLIAKYRLKLGAKLSCRLLTPEEGRRFLP